MDMDEAVAAAPPGLPQLAVAAPPPAVAAPPPAVADLTVAAPSGGGAQASMQGGSVASSSAATGGDVHPAGCDAVGRHASLRDDAQLRDTLMFIDGGYVTPFRGHMRSGPGSSSESALRRRLLWPPCWPHASALAAWGATDSRPGFPGEMACAVRTCRGIAVARR